jgi:hypothetical protein
MKKFFGILFVVFGFVCLPSVLSPSAAESLGRMIGLSLMTFLPAYFLLRNNKKEENDENQ